MLANTVDIDGIIMEKPDGHVLEPRRAAGQRSAQAVEGAGQCFACENGGPGSHFDGR